MYYIYSLTFFNLFDFIWFKPITNESTVAVWAENHEAPPIMWVVMVVRYLTHTRKEHTRKEHAHAHAYYIKKMW